VHRCQELDHTNTTTTIISFVAKSIIIRKKFGFIIFNPMGTAQFSKDETNVPKAVSNFLESIIRFEIIIINNTQSDKSKFSRCLISGTISKLPFDQSAI
jgi:hypothetical protein